MAEFRGNLYVFVDAFREENDVPPKRELGDIFGLRDPGEMLWYMHGWAVGNNARSSYCARTSVSKLRAFGTFAECMDFVRKRRKAKPKEQFHLVYEVDGRKSIVTSLEQIRRLDAGLGQPGCSLGSDDAEAPEFGALTDKVGKIVATNAAELLRIHRQEGELAARARFSSATYERLWRVLCDAAMVELSPGRGAAR